jgi:hypothetical protein
MLADGQTWQRSISFTESYPIAADLYRLPDLSHHYRNVDNGELSVPRVGALEPHLLLAFW